MSFLSERRERKRVREHAKRLDQARADVHGLSDSLQSDPLPAWALLRAELDKQGVAVDDVALLSLEPSWQEDSQGYSLDTSRDVGVLMLADGRLLGLALQRPGEEEHSSGELELSPDLEDEPAPELVEAGRERLGLDSSDRA